MNIVKRIHIYTAEIFTSLPGPGGYRGNPDTDIDIGYRLAILGKMLVLVKQQIIQNPDCFKEQDLITICFPEFFFRGGRQGCYFVDSEIPVSTEGGHRSHYFARRSFATEILNACQDVANEVFRHIVDEKKLAGVVVCCGTAAISKERVSKYFVNKKFTMGPQEFFDKQQIGTVKIDNFALIVAVMNAGQEWNFLVEKRSPAAADYLSAMSSPLPSARVGKPGLYVTVSTRDLSSKTLALPLSRSLRTPPHYSSPTLYPEAKQSEMKIIERTYGSIPGTLSPLKRERTITIGASICADFALSIPGIEYNTNHYQEKLDILFVPAVNLGGIYNGHNVAEMEDNGIIIYAEGYMGAKSAIARSQNGKVSDKMGNGFVKNPRLQEFLILEPSEDKEQYYMYTDTFNGRQIGPKLTYWGNNEF